MTVVTSRAEIQITVFTLMISIDFVLVTMLMAENALEHSERRWVHVTSGAVISPDRGMCASINREVLCIVIPVRRTPTAGRVTGLTGSRE
jgi:hypothetical protein